MRGLIMENSKNSNPQHNYAPVSAGLAWFLLQGFYILVFSLLLIELFIHKHGRLFFENAYGFFPAFGFLSALVLIFLAKGLSALFQKGAEKESLNE